MFSKKDYSKMTLEELVSEEKKIRSQKITTGVLVVFLVSVAVWSATHKGGFILTVALLGFALFIGSGYLKNLNSIQAEISRRNTID